MHLLFSQHARRRMRQRNITEGEVRACLTDYRTRIVGVTSSVCIADAGTRSLKVVVAADRDGDTERFIITTAWRGDDDN
ncbi:DUF4258 domain-containing protein [Actinokineospora sp. NBRC 105648]|uniref:DUF4258 domain-containing protein n=1 Tax=Actinokineospora sp. NBRC 105648 TaxID=3032206 RepID=UPI00332EE5C6